MAMTDQDGAGFFGKVPSYGDFVSRRLPSDFIGPWDAWLQACMGQSRACLGDAWLPAYLNSPIWRFALGAGVCGPRAWTGVMMPSVDRVGRYFPLTLAHVMAGDAAALSGWPVADGAWYGRLEALALSCLDAGFSLARFDASMASVEAPPNRAVSSRDATPVSTGHVRFWRDGGAVAGAGAGAMPIAGQGLPSMTTFTGEFLCN